MTDTTAVPYLDTDLPIEDRVTDLIGRMTVEEKAGQLTQYFYLAVEANLPEGFDLAALPEEQRAFLDQTKMVDAAVRTGRAGSALFVKDPVATNRLQRIAVDESRLGIPLLFGFDVIHGLRTAFPVPIAMAATWDEDVVEQSQAIAAREARAVGIHWAFAPMIDIARDPRWGRIVEGAGEDPFLASAVSAAQVRGFQGDLGPEHILAGPKHFAGYGAARGGRDYDDADISDSELWNVYFPPFRAAVEAGALNVMSAYMDLNGVPASGNRWLLTDVLRNELGFDGFVVSDANAVRSMQTQHFAEDLTEAGARALHAGLDMEMTMFDPAYDRLPEALQEGAITSAELDQAVARVLTAKFRLGLFENPYTDESATASVLDAREHRDLAQGAAERSLVLLKNEQATLPLRQDALRSIAVIGQLADSRRDTIGPWMFDQDTEETVTILDGLRSRSADHITVAYAPGAGIPDRAVPSPFDGMDRAAPKTPVDYDDDAAIDEAVAISAAADIAIVVVGQRQNQIGEAASSATLELGGRQLEQLERIADTGTPVVVLVMTGRPVDLRWADKNAAAILQVWYPGTRGGDAVARALIGEVSPGGKLPFTWPRHVGQVPMIYGHYRTFQPGQQDARYFDEPSTPLYPFGFGLSYGRFDYSEPFLDRDSIRVGEEVTIAVDVTNASGIVADEVVQLYIHQRHGTSTRPVRELKGFRRITLEPGETQTVSFTLAPKHLSYWSAATRSVVQDPTTIDIWVGGDVRAERTTVLEVTPGPPA
jgi:beta-glucosidase